MPFDSSQPYEVLDGPPPAFDPTQPHEVLAPRTGSPPVGGNAPAFDPSAPYEVVDNSAPPAPSPAADNAAPRATAPSGQDEITAYQPTMLEKVQSALSPLLGETADQTRARQAMLQGLPSVVSREAATRTGGAEGENFRRSGIVPALANLPIGPQIKAKQAPAGAGGWEQAAYAVRNIGANVANSLMTPAGLLLAGGGAPAKIVSAIFGGLMAKSAVQNAAARYAVATNPKASVQARVEAAGSEGLDVLGAAAGVRGAWKDVQAAAGKAVPETAGFGNTPEGDASVPPTGEAAPAQAKTATPANATPGGGQTAAAPEYRYTVQQAQTHPQSGGTIPGYVQIQELRNGANARSTDLATLKQEGVTLPEPPPWLPTGQYRQSDIEAAIKAGPPAGLETTAAPAEPVPPAAESATSGSALEGGGQAVPTMERTAKGATLKVGNAPDGTPDLLTAIENEGGAPGPKRGARTPEYDGFNAAFSQGPARLLRRANMGGIDTFVERLAEQGFKFDSLDDFYEAVRNASAQRVKMAAQLGDLQYGAKFDAALMDNSGRRAHLDPGEPVAVDNLNVGDTFKVRGEPVTVTGIDPDTGSVRIEDGVKREIPAGTPIFPDANTLKQAQGNTDFLDSSGRVSPALMMALGRTGAGAALGYWSGETDEEKARNAVIGALAGLGAPAALRLLRTGSLTGEPAAAPGAAAQGGTGTAPAATAPELKIGEAPGMGGYKPRGFVESVQESPDIAPQVKALVNGVYEPKEQKTVQAYASKLLDELVAHYPDTGLQQAKAAFLSSKDAPTAESWAVGLELSRRLAAQKDYAGEADILSSIAKQATTPARALAQLATLDKFSTPALGLYVERQGGKLTPAARTQVDRLKTAADAATNPEAKLARQMELYEYINDQVPTPLGQKLARGLPLSLIFHTKVFVKKALGDTTQMVLRTAADNIVPAFDAGYSLVTGTGRTRTWVSVADQLKGLGQPVVDFMAGARDARAQGADVFPSIQAGVKTMATLARAATRSSFLDNGTADVRGALRHTYSGRVLRAAEDLVSFGMGVPTRMAYMRAYQARLAMEMKLAQMAPDAGAAGQLFTPGQIGPSPDMIDRAHLAGMEATFSHPNPFSHLLADARTAFNFRLPIGIGSALAPLSKVPGGIVDMAVRYSPLGFVRASYKGGLAKVLGSPEAVDRGAALDAFTQAALGTTGLVGTGWWLAKNGIITGAAEENRDAEAVRQAAGFGKYSINLTALKRMMVTGKWDTPQAAEVGDLTMPYTWAQPVGLGLAMGAEMYHQGQIARRAQEHRGLPQEASSVTQGLLGAGRSLEDMDLFQGLSRWGHDTVDYGFVRGLGMQALNLPAMFVPSIFRDVRNFQDNTVRQLAVSDPVQAAMNKFGERIPYLADKLGYPAARDRFGDAVKRYDVGGNGWINVLLNPTYLRRIKADPAGNEVLRLWRNSGDSQGLPAAVPMTMEINDAKGRKQTVALTPQQISDMQHWEGRLTQQIYLQAMHNPRYVYAPDPEKAKVLARIQTAVHAAGKMILLGDVPLDSQRQPRAPGELETLVMAEALRSAELSGMTRAGPLLQRLANRRP